MAKKRPRIKGRGAEIFLGGGEESETPETNKPEQSPTDKTMEQQVDKPEQPLTDKTVKQQADETIKQYAGKTANTGKATFYLPPDLIDDLENTWLTLRRNHKDKRATKSEIARIALEEILRDWKEKQDNSILVNKLISR